MKYIITESKINKFVSIYLNREKWYVEDIGDGEFNIFNNDDSINPELKFRIQYSSTVPNKEFNILYIDPFNKYNLFFTFSPLTNMILWRSGLKGSSTQSKRGSVHGSNPHGG